MKNVKKSVSLLLTVIITVMSVFVCALSASAVTAYYGDTDGDGKITASDARTVLRISVKLEGYNAAALYRYDVNEDGNIKSDDARIVLRMSVSLDKLKVYTGTSSGSGSSHSAEDEALFNKISTQMGYFSDGEFYMEASTVQNDTVSAPMVIACKGNNVYFSSDFEGIQLGILTTGTKTNKSIYMISDKQKVYIKMSDAMLTSMGMKTEDLSFDLSFDSACIDGVAYTVNNTTVNGGSGKLVTFKQDDGSVSKITTDKNGTIVRIAICDANGATTSDMIIYKIEDTAPASKVSVPTSYYKCILITTFFAKIMG